MVLTIFSKTLSRGLCQRPEVKICIFLNMGMKFGTKEISDYDISSLFGDNSRKMNEMHKERTNHHSRLTVSRYIRNASGRIAKGMKV